MKASVPSAAPAAGERRPRRRGQVLKLFAAASFFALALPLGFLAGLLGWHQHRILTAWPVTDAVVVRADRITATNRTPGQPAAYSVRFTFRYPASGRVYQSSSQLGFTSKPSKVETWMQQMPVGSHARLRYDPSNPTQVSLVTAYTPRSFALPIKLAKWAGLAAALSAILLFLGWRAGRQNPVVGSR